MARMMALLVLLCGACEDATEAFAQDLAVKLDLSMSACEGAANPNNTLSCDRPAAEWCFPDNVPEQLICVCAHPAMKYTCCVPDTYTCPLQPRTGDFCCPQPSGFRSCGNCLCIDGQFVCDVDAGTD